MNAEEQARADIVEVGRRLWDRGFVASNDGNISVRLGENRLITTPTAVSKGFILGHPDLTARSCASRLN
jgi:L-fuculose-phosphate aldolase